MNKRVETGLHYFFLLMLIYLVVFLKLGNFHLRWWDESMFAVNTFEMIQNGNWFSLYYNHTVDLFNTKPPLTTWFQVLFVKMIGYNELAVRLPSAIAAGVTILVLFRFLSKQFNVFYAWISALILLTSYGFLNFHTGRTADSDALLTLFVFVANVFFVQFVLNQKKKNIYFFFFFITLAFATKLYAALLFAPAYLGILIYQKLLKKFIVNQAFVLGVLFFVMSIGSLTYLRELDAPGYLHEVIYKDAGRMSSVVENHKENTFYYMDNFINYRYSYWFVFFVLGVILSFSNTEKKQRTILHSLLAMVLSYLIIVMISVTKLEWYDMPLFPYLAVVSAYPIYWMLQKVRFNEIELKPFQMYLLLAVLFIYPYSIMFSKAQGNTISVGERKLEANEMYLFQRIKDSKNLDGVKVYHNTWNGSLLFYKYKLSGVNQGLELVKDFNLLHVNDKVLVSDEILKENIVSRFNIKVLDSKYNAELYLLESSK